MSLQGRFLPFNTAIYCHQADAGHEQTLVIFSEPSVEWLLARWGWKFKATDRLSGCIHKQRITELTFSLALRLLADAD